jgi:DNA polymerase (family 10)
MTNLEICRLFRNVAAAYAIKDEKRFRFQILAYQKAADVIEQSSTELREYYKEGKTGELPGIGSSIKSHLEELFRNGKVAHFEDIFSGLSKALFPLLDIPSFGPKKAYKLVAAFNLNNPDTVISDLEKLAKSGKIATLEGFGEKSQTDILQAIHEYAMGKTKTNRMTLSFASELADRMVSYLKKSKAVGLVYPLGSLRRRMPTIGDIDIAVASNKPRKVLEHFSQYPEKERLIEKGDKTASILISSGRQVDLMVVPPEAFGALLQHFTGSKAHNVHLREYALTKGLSLSDYGIRKKGEGNDKALLYKNEEDFYKAIGLAWIPPEMRENTGEIELAIKDNLPKLVQLKDIKGDFHLHSSYPIEPSHDMGSNNMDEMIQKALELKYKYIGFSEHNPSVSKHTPKQRQKILIERNKYIERLRVKYKNVIRIFSLLETDILINGDLAIEKECLDLLDGSIVSIHSGFDMDSKTMTNRVLKGLSHPKAKILAHPTGRLLNQRAGYELEWDRIFEFCLKNNKALEVNSSPLRLDLPDSIVRKAIGRKVKLFIDTDSHKTTQMDLMEYGVSVARRGWARANDILNTKSYNELEAWFKE